MNKQRHETTFVNYAIPVLFKPSNEPYTSRYIKRKINQFGKGYNYTVRKVIQHSDGGLNKDVFKKNIAVLMPNFLMTRAGAFKGVSCKNGCVKDPKSLIEECWKAVGEQTKQLRSYINAQNRSKRTRALISMPISDQKKVADELWIMFKSLLPLCIGTYSFGLVGASKVLFAVLPEVSLPVDNAEWRTVFRTVDYCDVILQMASEITRWEKETKKRLDDCDLEGHLTLSAVYNVMAMEARKRGAKLLEK